MLYIAEACEYRSADDWAHYRTWCDTAVGVLPAFDAHFHDRPFDYSGWEGVSDELR